MAGRYSREQWQAWIAEQEQSGLPISEFCRRNDTLVASFYYWRKKLSTGTAGATAQETSRAHFVPVAIKESVEVEITLPCGATLRVPHSGPTLEQVLKTLLEFGATS